MLSKPVECHTFVFLSVTWVRSTFPSDTGPLHFYSVSNASVCHVKTISPDWTCAVKYQMSCRLLSACTVEKSLYRIPNPSNPALWRKQTQLLLAIDTFVVPLCWTARVCRRNAQLLLVHVIFCQSALKDSCLILSLTVMLKSLLAGWLLILNSEMSANYQVGHTTIKERALKFADSTKLLKHTVYLSCKKLHFMDF